MKLTVSILLPALFFSCIFIYSCSSKRPMKATDSVFATVDQTPHQDTMKASIKQIDEPDARNTRLSSDYNSTTNNKTKPTYIPNIVTLDKITADVDFSHLLAITINNPYDKPISVIQMYIGENGNVSIPEGISEDDDHLRNMKIQPLQPNTQGNFVISTNDKGAEGQEYTVSVRRIRFTDGSTINP